MVKVSAKGLRRVELYKLLPSWRRLDVWPFYLLYAGVAVVGWELPVADALIVAAAAVSLHALTFLFTFWSTTFRCFAHFQKEDDPLAARFCKVIPAAFAGSKQVVQLEQRVKAAGSSGLLPHQKPKDKEVAGTAVEVSFEFRKQQFILEGDTFRKLQFPTKEPISSYFACSGYGTDAKVQAARERWGLNKFIFPLPTFWELFKQQCTAPFFVFQVFCVGLWCLDEMWQYSLFTLAMLLMFESTVVKSRQRSLMELRRVRTDPSELHIQRGGKWVKLKGEELLPGDVISIGRFAGAGSEERTVPADALLLYGTCIANEALLTGESHPQWKVPGSDMGLRSQVLNVKRDKLSVLFGGTKILQHTPDKDAPLKAPDGGCIAVVLRTGFDTTQGKLMRKILFSTETVSANNLESGLFILFLLIFALMAAYYVLVKGLEDPTRSRYRLLLNCSLIITSVIPPELPMELSIAVNTSLVALARLGIFCTEPFRIPYAGKVDALCFDKTGTLTSDNMVFEGVSGADKPELQSDPAVLSEPVIYTLAACHALVQVDTKLVGDPLEKAALHGVGWVYTGSDVVASKRSSKNTIRIVHRHHFSSQLKRMSVIARVDNADAMWVFVKGAPEVLALRMQHMPAGYDDAYKYFTRQGARVLALGYRCIGDKTVSEVKALDRDEVERDLSFGGFAVFSCPLKPDSAAALEMLKNSSHDLVMITGDQALTACHAASKVHIVSRPVLVLTQRAQGHPASSAAAAPGRTSEFDWLSPDETQRMPFQKEEIETVASSFDLCMAGDGLTMLDNIGALADVVPYVQVFARVSPEQKEVIITTLKAAGRVTLMCGDGTNDVGALKQANVGVALLNAPPPKKKPSAKAQQDGSALANSNQQQLAEPRQRRLNGASNASATTAMDKHKQAQDKLQQWLKDKEEEMAQADKPLVQLGDASMASPFTAKHSSVMPVTHIIRQGRSTLVTTLQMFKILGLNCLSSAYMLSVMYLDGVKLGDTQATIAGVFTAAFFLFISNSKPLPTLSKQRPHPNIFSPYMFLSLLGQFAVHLTFLILSVQGAQSYLPQDMCMEPDTEFHPNLVNTVSYTVNMLIAVSTFAVNYIGHPFNNSISENKPFFAALVSAAAFFSVLAADIHRPLNDWLELVPLPPALRNKVLVLAALDFVAAYMIEYSLRWLLPVKPPAFRKMRRKQQQANHAAAGVSQS
eukprot:jgi/Chlat1/8336/Chrsp8S08098